MHFNSIKVRLELLFGTVEVGLHQFQFHKGAIRTFENLSNTELLSNFNSIKVRLELRALCPIDEVKSISIP